MHNKTLVFSKAKKLRTIYLEDLYKLENIPFSLNSLHGFNCFKIVFPKMELLGLNCFYVPKFQKFRVCVSIVINQIKLFIKGLSQGFFLEFKIIGLGFRVKKNANFLVPIIRFDIGFSHFIKMPISSLIKLIRAKKRFIIFSYDYQTLKIFLKNIQNLRKHNPYKTRGLKLVGFKTRHKPGKKQNRR